MNYPHTSRVSMNFPRGRSRGRPGPHVNIPVRSIENGGQLCVYGVGIYGNGGRGSSGPGGHHQFRGSGEAARGANNYNSRNDGQRGRGAGAHNSRGNGRGGRGASNPTAPSVRERDGAFMGSGHHNGPGGPQHQASSSSGASVPVRQKGEQSGDDGTRKRVSRQFLPCQINGQRVVALLASGASRTYMTHKIMKTLHLSPFLDEKVTGTAFGLVDTMNQTIVGQLSSIPVQLAKGIIIHVDFLVIENEHYDALYFGRDALVEHDFVIGAVCQINHRGKFVDLPCLTFVDECPPVAESWQLSFILECQIDEEPTYDPNGLAVVL